MDKIAQLIKSGKASIVDVRTPAEFMGGHVAESMNIPLLELSKRIDGLRKMENIVLCCASGGRSAQATEFLNQKGIECEDGGSWMQVNRYY